jgi:hypothetical protein
VRRLLQNRNFPGCWDRSDEKWRCFEGHFRLVVSHGHAPRQNGVVIRCPESIPETKSYRGQPFDRIEEPNKEFQRSRSRKWRSEQHEKASERSERNGSLTVQNVRSGRHLWVIRSGPLRFGIDSREHETARMLRLCLAQIGVFRRDLRPSFCQSRLTHFSIQVSVPGLLDANGLGWTT